MFRAMTFPIALVLFGAVLLGAQRPSVDITTRTKWLDNRAVKIIAGTLHFKAETDIGDEVRECAKVIIDITFRNNSKRPIRRIDFEVVLYGSETPGNGNSKSRILKKEKFSYDQIVPPAKTGSLLHELSECGLFSPVRQTLRIDRIIYEDGSSRDGTRPASKS